MNPTRIAPKLGFLAGALALVLAGCGPATPEVQATIGLTYIPNIQFAPFYVAEQSGKLPAGVGLRHHGSGEGLFTALASGEEDFIVAGGDEILQARAQGIDVVAVAAYYLRYPVRLLVPASSPVNSLDDLRGKTIGLPGRYGENWFALVIAMQQASLTEADLTIQEIGYTQQVALPSGQVDATIGFTNGDAVTFAANGFAVRQIDLEVPLVSICLGTTSSFAAAHPEMVKQLVNALDQAIVTIRDTPEQAITAAGKYIPDFDATAQESARQVLDATIPLFFAEPNWISSTVHPRAWLDPDQWQVMAEAMDQAGLLETSVDATQAIYYLPE